MSNTRKNLEDIFVSNSSSKEEEAPKNKRMRKLFTRKVFLYLVVLLLALGFIYYFLQYRNLAKKPDAVTKEKTSEVIKKISELAIVPNDPNAVLATVTDVTKLKNEKFFTNAQNGDYVVLFPSALKAVLYRPSNNKIVEIGPLSSSQGTGSTLAPTTSTTTQNTKIATTTSIKTPVKTPIKKK